VPVVIGNYRQRVALERPSRNSTEDYEVVEDRVPAQVSFNIQELPERREAGRAFTAAGPYSIRLRYRTDIRSEWRVRECDTGQVFQILSWGDRTGRREEVWIVAQESQ
jgi:head-tail adaptor